MVRRLNVAIAVFSLLNGPALADGLTFNDAQIAHIAYTAGVIDVTLAKQALSTSSSEAIRAFAEDMVRDHEAVNKLALDVVKKLNVPPRIRKPAAPSQKMPQPNTTNWQN
jgi:putative membrane protein